MVLCRLIPAKWALKQNPALKNREGFFTDDELADYNALGYNIYYLPNYPSQYDSSSVIDGTHIDTFNWVFVDCDLKDGKYASKDAFLAKLASTNIPPTQVIDSGNGVHAYWKVSGLDAMSYLRFQRRLMRVYHTDEAVGQLFQLMRLPGTVNVKDPENYIMCDVLTENTQLYTAEQLDQLLPPIQVADEEYCKLHYDRTYGLNQEHVSIDDVIPPKFGKLLRENTEVKDLWANKQGDRSKADYRLGHLMHANGFTKGEALSVLVNSAKALERAPVHRANYAEGIVAKIWTFEAEPETRKNLSPTVRDILSKGDDVVTGTRFPCHPLVDDTVHGFRLGQVIGIVGGSGTGKTTLTLNKFLWFAERNPDYHHFFFSLEQPIGEIAKRISTICQGNESLYDKIHVVSNYDTDGTYVNFSLDMVKDHIVNFEQENKVKVGAVVIDHIGVLARPEKKDESQGIISICRAMKAVAVATNTMILMLSQAPREKAGIGDLELNKDAAFGTVFFESFVDYLICLWQPLKRVYTQGAPTVMAFKFAKIRHKKQNKDRIQEDTCYQVFFNPDTELLRELTQDEETSAKFWTAQATNLRKKDRKTDVVTYESRRVTNDQPSDEPAGTKPTSDRHATRH